MGENAFVASRDGREGGSPAVRRTLRLFEHLMDAGAPVSMPQLIEALAIPKSTAYELVRLLTDEGYLELRGDGVFLGMRLFQLGQAYRAEVDLLRDGAQVVRALRDRTGETVQFSVLLDEHMHVLMKEEGLRPLRIVSRAGSRVPVNWAASGRLLVSGMEEKELRAMLLRTMRPSPSGRACTEVSTFIAQSREARARGWASELNETNEHAGCLAAPVIDGTGRCVAAISVVVPEPRITGPDREELLAAVVETAASLSRRLEAVEDRPALTGRVAVA